MFGYGGRVEPFDHDAVDAQINRLGAALLFDPVTLASAAEEGVADPVVLYAGGRAGAVGDLSAAAVEAVLAFFAPSAVAEVWPMVLAHGRPSEIAATYARAMADAARAHWSAAAAEVVAEVGGHLVAAAPAVGLPLFAGWRAQARPADPLGAAAHAVVALRELRFDHHVHAVAGAGLHPLEAEIVGRGEPGAQLHGWSPPYPDPGPLRARVAAAEAETSRRMAAVHALIAPDEQQRLAAAIAALQPT